MKLNLSATFQSLLTRIATNVENEAYYNEVHETSEPIFWLVFGAVLIISSLSVYVISPIRHLLGGR